MIIIVGNNITLSIPKHARFLSIQILLTILKISAKWNFTNPRKIFTAQSFTLALNNVEKNPNEKLLSSRAIVERSFCICKTHWRCLLKRLDNKVKNVLDVIFTCLALHNFCQINGEIKLIKTLYLRISFKRRW